MEFLADAHLWVAVAFLVFIGFTAKPVGRVAINALDERSRKIKNELDEAMRLREEAQTVLESYQKKQRESLKEAEEIIAGAKKDAERMRVEAEQNLRVALDSRMKLAVEKIAQSEAKALEDVQNHLVEIAISAASSIILEHMDKASGEELVKLAITDIERKVH